MGKHFNLSFTVSIISLLFYQIVFAQPVSHKKAENNSDDSIVADTKMISALTKEEVVYQWPEPGSTNTGGWVETEWFQGLPYNQFCPIDSQAYPPKHSAVGCIATAMAQVINYHHYIGEVKFDFRDAYTFYQKQVPINIGADSIKYAFPGFGTLNQYLEKIDYKYKNNINLNDTEKSALCFAVGVSVKMAYSEISSTILSGNYMDTAPPFKDKFNYHNADHSLATKKSFRHDLIENLMNGYPAVIFFDDHAVVVDGYKTDGRFHMNFAWSKDNPAPISKVWYKPDSSELPGDYTEFMSGIINIKPFKEVHDISLTADIDQIKIPCTIIGQVSREQTLIITNNGTVPFNVDDILISEYFRVVPFNSENFEGQSMYLNPQETFKLKVYCSPYKIGKLTGTLQILASHGETRRHLIIDLCCIGVEENGTTISKSDLEGVLSAQNSPYFVCTNIRVAAGQKLKIEPGTTLLFTGPYTFTIGQNSHFIARGTEKDSIYFKSLDEQTKWRGIQFIDSDSNDTLSYCIIQNVKAKWAQNESQAAASIYKSSPVINHSTFQNNSSEFRGTIYLLKSSAQISNCVLKDNTCTTTDGGGALYIKATPPSSTLLLNNLLIIRNHAIKGGAIHCENSTITMNNLTITENFAKEDGDAIFLSGYNNIEINNSIIWQNNIHHLAKAGVNKAFSESGIIIHYSDIDTTSKNWIGGISSSETVDALHDGEGNTSQDPLFVNPSQNNYTLGKDSPCIDKGAPYDDYNLEPQPNGGRINMGAYGGTLKAASGEIITIIGELSPGSFQLDQNYPNPFNPSTTIKYALPTTNYVELIVYNILGQKVAVLVSANQPAGKYKIEWDASDYANGMYYYRLSAGNFVETKKMILVQ